MEIHQIRYFLAVARERNFSRAAESCNITQPALTRAIQRLEDELRGEVFERRPGHVELTELGRALVPRFEQTLAAIADAKALARNLIVQRRHRLRLGLMCTLGPNRLMMLLGALMAECPEIELQINEARALDLIGLLTRDEIDVAIVGLPRYPPTLDAEPLYAESYRVAMAPHHPLAAREAIALRDFDGLAYIERVHCEFEQHYADIHGNWSIPLDVRCRSDREDCVQALVASGLGVAIVPGSMELRGDVITRPLIEPAIERTISIVTSRDRELQPSVVILKRLVQEMLT